MARRILRQKTAFSIILISMFALSLISTYAPAVLGTWTSDGSFTEFNSLITPYTAVDNYIQQSVAVSPFDQSVHVVFLSDGIAEDLILYQSSKNQNLEDFQATTDFELLSNTPGNEVLIALANPDVAVDRNGNAHVVFEGVYSGNGQRYIYYTNNSWNGSFYSYERVDPDAVAGETNPSVVCTDDGYINVIYTEGGTVYAMRSSPGVGGMNFDGPVIVASGCNNAEAVNSTTDSGVASIYVVCTDASNRPVLANATSSNSWQVWSTYTSAFTGFNPKIDADGEFGGVTYWRNVDDVYVFTFIGMNSYSGETLVTTTSGSDPTVTVDRHGGVSVIYSRNIGLFGPVPQQMHQGIFIRSSRDNAGYSIEDNIATDTTYATPSEATYKRYPVSARYNDTVVIVYQRAEFIAGGLRSWKLYVNGFVNTYQDSSSSYSRIMVGEDPQGVYLFESLILSYNSSVAYDVNITITDNETGISWTNITQLPAGGGYEQKIVFYNMNEMFLSNKFYWITISNASVASGPKLAKFWVDFARKADYDLGDPRHYYITEETGPNGTLSQYKVGIEWRGYLDRLDLPEGRENQLTGTFSSTNHIDLYQIKLDNKILYNLTVSEASSTDMVEVRLYNSTPRLATASNAMFTFNTALSGIKSLAFIVNHTQVGTVPYYVMVLRQNNTHAFNYNIFYEQAPHAPLPIRPGNQFFNTMFVQFEWLPSGFEANQGVIAHYDFQIDTVNTFDSPSLQSLVFYGENNRFYNFTPSVSSWFYWRVSVTDINFNQGPWTSTQSFAVDITAPGPPVVTELPLFHKTGSFKINWTIPSDAPFTVKYYNVYMSTKPNVALTAANLVTVNNTLKTNQYYTNSLSPGYYYFKITATDNAGWESTALNEVHTVVVFGEYFNSTLETFYVQAGDTIEYEILNVISPTETGTGIPTFTFGYGSWATQFVTGDRFHFWIKDVDRLSVTPVLGDFYAKSKSLATYSFVTAEYSLVPFVASSNPTFMRNVSEAFVKGLISDQGKILSQINFTGTFQDGLNILDTFCFTYRGTYEDGSSSGLQATFAYDLSTGVLVELTVLDEVTGIGYTLKLYDGTPDFVPSWKSWAPVIFVAAVMILAGIINIVVRRVEYR